jgi:hypothetical protein
MSYANKVNFWKENVQEKQSIILVLLHLIIFIQINYTYHDSE